jgi:hypothetical protein
LKDKDKDEDDDLVQEDEDKEPALKIQLDEAANILSDYILMQRDNYAASRALQ